MRSKNYKTLKHTFTKKQHLLSNRDMWMDVKAWLKKEVPEYQAIADILDYDLPYCREFVPHFDDDVEAIVNTGGSEGIYLDIYFTRRVNGEPNRRRAVTIKTLHDDFQAYLTMGQFAGMLTTVIEHWMNYNYEFIENNDH